MSQCYDWHSDTQSVGHLPTDIWLQCPSGNTCCVAGSICLDHNLCHVPGSSSSSSSSGSYSSYYVARCSDPTYTSPDCQKVCDAPGPPDAVYNYTSQQWNCCGKNAAGDVSCNKPTDDIFQAPAPADLKELSSGVAIVSTATLAAGEKSSTSTSSSSSTSTSSSSTETSSIPLSSSSTSATATSPSNSASTSPSQPSQTTSPLTTTPSPTTLSTGAKAGIGIGVALAIIALIALIFFLLERRRRRQSTAAADTAEVSAGANGSGYGGYVGEEKHAGSGVVEKGVDGDGDVRLPRSELEEGSREGLVGRNGGNGGGLHELGSSR